YQRGRDIVVELWHLEDRVLRRHREIADGGERAADAERLALHDRERRRSRLLHGCIKRKRHLGDRMTHLQRRHGGAIDLWRLPALAEVRTLAAQPHQLDLGPELAQHT